LERWLSWAKGESAIEFYELKLSKQPAPVAANSKIMQNENFHE
jgi:hypothetical protein